jgi:hypothetical protein
MLPPAACWGIRLDGAHATHQLLLMLLLVTCCLIPSL